jgi:hypothetical protein
MECNLIVMFKPLQHQVRFHCRHCLEYYEMEKKERV